MAENNFTSQSSASSGCFKEAVCINAGRVYDSCSDKDCVEMRVVFTDTAQQIIDNATSIKCKAVQVMDVFMDVEPVPFNKGFYSVDMTFYFVVQLEACTMDTITPVPVDGLAVFTKKVILYGSEGNVNVFTSDKNCVCPQNTYAKDTTPKSVVQVVNPICLAAKIKECCPTECCVSVPASIASRFDGEFTTVVTNKFVEVTLGVFSIVSLARTVQMMIPVYDFSIPDKECVQINDDPCELFKRIKFPVNEFFPPRLSELQEEDGCGCDIPLDRQ